MLRKTYINSDKYFKILSRIPYSNLRGLPELKVREEALYDIDM